MSSLINDNLFLLLLIFGCVLVSIRAHELFSTPTPRNDAQWLVDEMHMRHLTGRRQFATGFAFYLMPVLLMYLLLSVSPEILNLSMGIAGTTNSVGALTLSGSQVHTFAPMLAATAVITLLSVKPFSILEQSIRRASHGIAGIPQHVQDIIRQIRQLDFRAMTADTPLPRMQLDHVEAIPGLDNDLAAIRQLDEWIFGSIGMLVWSDKANHALQLARHRILGEYDGLKRKLALKPSATDDADAGEQILTDQSLEEIVRRSRELRIQFTRLLAVLIANQDEPMPSRVASQPLWDLVSRAQRRRASSRHINVLAASTLTGIVISTVFATLFNITVKLANDLSIDNAALDLSSGALFIAGQSPGEFYWSSLIYAARTAWWDVLGIGLLFFTGCSAALIYRAARVNSAEWELWHPSSHPVFQYVIVAMLASVCAGLFYEIFLFFKLVVWPSLQVRNAGHFASMLRDFGSDYVEFGLLALLAAPSAVMLCRLSDNFGAPSDYPRLWRDPEVRRLAWAVGLVSLIVYLFVRLWIGEIYDLAAVLLSLTVPAVSLWVMSVCYWRIGELRPNQAQEPGSSASSATPSSDRSRDSRTREVQLEHNQSTGTITSTRVVGSVTP